MKKKTKKLVLAKETVRSLSARDLREVAGGETTFSNPYSYSCDSCPREPKSINAC